MEEPKHSEQQTDVIRKLEQEIERLRKENLDLRRRLEDVWGEA